MGKSVRWVVSAGGQGEAGEPGEPVSQRAVVRRRLPFPSELTAQACDPVNSVANVWTGMDHRLGAVRCGPVAPRP